MSELNMSYDGKRRCFYFTEKDLKVTALLIGVFKREEAAARTWGEDKDEEGEEGRDGTGANSSG